MININYFISYLNELYPDAHCQLNYKKDYELLIAIMLSAQTSDIAVNKATAILFNHYKTLNDLKIADLKDLENIISFLGMKNIKSKNIKNIATLLVDKYDGVVPKSEDELLSFPGVGVKTKNCFLAEYYSYPLLAIDTHVQRICKRLSIVSENDNPLIIEEKLYKLLPKDKIVLINHQIISFGRHVCKAKNPNCGSCKLNNCCHYFKNKVHQ